MKGELEVTTKKRGNNEGSIYLRENGTWRAQISLRGKRISYSGATKADCQKWIREQLHTIDEMVDCKEPSLTVNLDRRVALGAADLHGNTSD